MGGWITVGLGAVAAMCPLSPDGGAAVAVDPPAGEAHVVVCVPDAWVEIGVTGTGRPDASAGPPAEPDAPPTRRAPDKPGRDPASPAPARPPAPETADPTTPATAPPPGAAREPGEPPAAARKPAAAPAAPFRWVPRNHRRPPAAERDVPGGLSVVTTTTVVTTPAILAAVALRPGTRRRRG
ncbi:hypothetical protein ABZX40_15380 [Streptomyces sp. NPDC004610]|uniref:hypothetical protein n=1 Tax=unclassified Streptomyces TaxID=2593676 RepID=UPI0033B9F5BF